jgi:hypothetical protein
MAYEPGHPIDEFFEELRALAERHGMGPVRMGYRHDAKHRLQVILVSENKQYPWGDGYVPTNHPRRIQRNTK